MNIQNNYHHKSVLLDEAILSLEIKPDGNYFDCTLGLGGHSSAILKHLSSGKLISIDKDKEAIEIAKNKLSKINDNFVIYHSDFNNISSIAKKEQLVGKIDGFLFDLGISSLQIDKDDRGFSFNKIADLDMRMNIDQKITAKDVINKYSERDLAKIFYLYGEEKNSRKIARNIINYRQNNEITKTNELSEIIKKAFPIKYQMTARKHLATKCFQAIRIEVNQELKSIESALLDAHKLLRKGGIICVISFHSLEDRIVKNIFKRLTEINLPKDILDIPDEYIPKFIKCTKKPIYPSKEEQENNPRSSSAKMRVIKKVKE